MNDHVLVDLRDFTADNRGVQTELSHVVSSLRTDRVVLLWNKATDRAVLARVLEKAWQQAVEGRGCQEHRTHSVSPRATQLQARS